MLVQHHAVLLDASRWKMFNRDLTGICIGVWAGGWARGGGAIKISEKLCYVQNIFVCVRKLRDIRENFFCMFAKSTGY
jgi:hypothetical protein